MNNNEALQYYQSRPQKAFLECFVGDTSYEQVNDEVYHTLKFYLPVNTRKKVRFLKKYFSYIDAEPGDPHLRRRKNWVEFAETATTILQRIDGFFVRKHTFVAGSPQVCQIPWAIFGKGHCWAQHTFRQLRDVSEYYRNYLHGKCFPVTFHFLRKPTYLFKLADRFKVFPLNNPNFWMGVALNLTHDLIHNCGPDCHEVFELFCNNYRIGPGEFPNHEFQDLRMRILGVDQDPMKGLPQVRSYGGGYSCHWKPKKSKVDIEVGDECFDLALGEKTVALAKPMLCLPPAKKDEALGPWRPPLLVPAEGFAPPALATNAPSHTMPIPKDMMDLMANPYFAMKYRRGLAARGAVSWPTPDMI